MVYICIAFAFIIQKIALEALINYLKFANSGKIQRYKTSELFAL